MIETTTIVQVVLVLGLTLLAATVWMRATREADALRKSSSAEAHQLREEARALMTDAQRREERIALREREVAEDLRNASKYAREVEQRVGVVARDERRLIAEREKLRTEHQAALAAAAKIKAPAAKKRLTEELLRDAEAAAQAELHKLDKRIHAEADIRAREVLATAMQRVAADTTSQHTVTWMSLPSDEMKGRIIGREGRNIRAFEALTGVNLLVEDGVDAVMLSSFDVERREIAEAALAALVADGRIHPQRIEEAYRVAAEAAPQRHVDAGLEAAEVAGVTGLRPAMIEALGRLRLRSSYGQNVLQHLVECANIASTIAAEMGADESLARRAAFLHDVGKAFTGKSTGSHAAVGARFAKDNGESEAVVSAIAAHHDEVEHSSLESVIVQIADAASAGRPGARREDSDGYAERLAELEKALSDIAGVVDVRAMSAGREVRVVVSPDKVQDAEVAALARTIAKRIADDPQYPGEVRVTVIRETRADAVAG